MNRPLISSVVRLLSPQARIGTSKSGGALGGQRCPSQGSHAFASRLCSDSHFQRHHRHSSRLLRNTPDRTACHRSTKRTTVRFLFFQPEIAVCREVYSLPSPCACGTFRKLPQSSCSLGLPLAPATWLVGLEQIRRRLQAVGLVATDDRSALSFVG